MVLAIIVWLMLPSSGRVVVPNVKNQTVIEAINNLRAKGLSPSPNTGQNALLNAARVDHTAPSANTQVTQGATVILYIALPDFSNMPLPAAVAQISEYALIPVEPPNPPVNAKVKDTIQQKGTAVPIAHNYAIKIEVQ